VAVHEQGITDLPAMWEYKLTLLEQL